MKLDPDLKPSSPTQTEDSSERGLTPDDNTTPDPPTYADLGESEQADDDAVGDIADEGRGHRG